MRYDLKTPCLHCPFRKDSPAIRFSCRERAEEIEETAYRHGFPCHKSAELLEDDEHGQESGYYAVEDTQLCVGYVIMRLNEMGTDVWPGINNDEAIIDRYEERIPYEARKEVFEDCEEFFEANQTD